MKRFFYPFLILLHFFACEKTSEPIISGAYSTGYFIVNEGIFGQIPGSITHFDPINKITSSEIFKNTNQRALGDIVQSISFSNDKAFIVVNNSNKIESCDKHSFESTGQLTGLKLPRYLKHTNDSIAYLSEWGLDGFSGQISKINLNSMQIEKHISTDIGPEHLLQNGNDLLVSHYGGYGNNNKISIIDLNTDSLREEIVVGDKPLQMQKDLNETIWVICSGNNVYTSYPDIDSAASTPAKLIQLDPIDYHIISELVIGLNKSASHLCYDAVNEYFYFKASDGIYRYQHNTNESTKILAGQFYGLSLTMDGRLAVMSNNGLSPSMVCIYDPTLNLIDTIQASYFASQLIDQ